MPLSFNLLSILGNQSVFDVSSSGHGKTYMIFSLIDALKDHLFNTQIDNWNAITYYELLERIGERYNTNLLWTVEEWSMLSDYHRELLMAISSKVQTDKIFERHVSKAGYTYSLKIINCNLALIIAIQPFKFRKLMRESDNWNSLASDRFIKFMLINPIQEDTKDYFPKFVLPECVNDKVEYDFPPMLTEVFTNHLTKGRAELASLKYQRAWCRLNGSLKFSKNDAMAFKLFYYPYLELYPLMIKANDPGEESSFYTGPFIILEYFMDNFGKDVSIHDILNSFHIMEQTDVSKSSVYRHLRILEAKGIIKSNSPTYTLSDRYIRYFENYRANWK